MAVPTPVAAALSGASIRQLAYWRSPRGDTPPLLVPEYRDGRTLLYSFRDVITLRTFAYIRGKISLQKIREAVRTLDRLGDEEHLSSYRLYVTDNSVVWITPDGEHVDLVEKPGQQRIEIVMRDVFAAFRNAKGMEVRPLYRSFNHISVDPEVRGGFPVLQGTRVPYNVVASLVRDGMSVETVSELYPSVDPLAIEDALRMADYVDRVRPAA